MINKTLASLILLIIFMEGCKSRTEVETQIPVETEKVNSEIIVSNFGELTDGTPMSLYTLKNTQGVVMKVINYGGIITSLSVPDRNGKMEDVVLGYDSIESYTKNNPYFGALVGRYGNRIAKGKFALDGKEYSLALNNGANSLHGGIKGFDKVIWKIEKHTADNGVALKLNYESKDMEEGFPGNLKAEVIYTLTNNNELKIDYKATTDKKTIINLTQHTYFNLTAGKQDILGHELTINADKFVPVDNTLIPLGELKPVANTPFNFTKPTLVGARINDNDEQLKFGKGYDHCWVLNPAKDGMNNAATLYDSISGREVIVYTTEPSVQFYSGNFLDGSITGKGGIVYKFRSGLCLETEHFPDSPNRADFPSVVLNPGEKYSSQTVYKFTVR